jgi:hypothetical protein
MDFDPADFMGAFLDLIPNFDESADAEFIEIETVSRNGIRGFV